MLKYYSAQDTERKKFPSKRWNERSVWSLEKKKLKRRRFSWQVSRERDCVRR